MLGSQNGIEHLLNLLSLIYAVLILLPYLNAHLQQSSAKHFPFRRSHPRKQLFFDTLAERIQTRIFPHTLLIVSKTNF